MERKNKREATNRPPKFKNQPTGLTVPIDGIKIVFYHEDFPTVLQALGVKILTPLEEATGELHFPKYAHYQNLKFKISASGRIEVRGSLHKYWKRENYSDFTYRELCECIKDLCQKCQKNALEMRITNVEFAVNVSTPFSPFEFCSHVLAYKNDTFDKFRDTGNGIDIGFECVNQQFTIKVYDKGKQNRFYIKGQLLRYEVRVTKMEYLKKAGVLFLSDLTDLCKLQSLAEILTDTYSRILINDIVDTAKLTRNQERIYLECSNPRIWETYTPGKRIKRKKQFVKIIEKYGQRKWKELAGNLIDEKLELMFIESTKSGNDLTDLRNYEG